MPRRSSYQAERYRQLAQHCRLVPIYLPQTVDHRIAQIAATFRVSRARVMMYALERAVHLVEYREWRQLAKAYPIRRRRKDAGVCVVCRRSRAERRPAREAASAADAPAAAPPAQ